MKKSLRTTIAESDRRIADALETLRAHNRGLNALADFKKLAEGPAMGLDNEGINALLVLVKEWALGSRRTFLNDISPVVLPPKPKAGVTRIDGHLWKM